MSGSTLSKLVRRARDAGSGWLNQMANRYQLEMQLPRRPPPGLASTCSELETQQHVALECLGLGAYPVRVLKIGFRVAAKERISNQDKQCDMHRHLRERVEKTDGHVRRHPNEGEPSCPVVPAQEECTGQHRNKTSERNPEVFNTKRLSENKLSEVDGKAEGAGSDQQPGYSGDRNWTFVHRSLQL